MAKAKATPKLISTLFYISHALLMILAIGFALCGIFTSRAEEVSLGKFNLKITDYNVKFSYATAGCLVIAAGFGIVAQLLGNKACLWVLYCGILGFFSLGLLAEGVAALGKASNDMRSFKTELRNLALETYNRDPDFHLKTSKPRADKRTPVGKAWDETQEKYKCCGLDDYTDWQTVSFGRTSLTVPISCCIEKLRKDPINGEWCGINVLPVMKHPEEKINPDGCFSKIIKNVNFQLTVVGYYSILVSVFAMGLVGAVSYLMVTKKM